MKLNGALKPRHGASIEGSSTGAGPLRKYRDKRYPQDTCEYVSHASLSPHQNRQQLLKGYGVNDENISTAAISSSSRNNNSSSSRNNRRHRDNSYEQPQLHEGQEQRDQPQQSRQEQRRQSSACDVIVYVNGSESVNEMTSSKSNGVGITLTTKSNTHAKQQNSIKSVEATRTTTTTRTIITDCSIQEIGTTTTEAAAIEPSEESGSHGNSTTITLKQTEQLNITTGPQRQRQGQQLQSGNNCGDKPGRRNEHTNRPGKSRVGEELPIANYHAISPTSEGNNAPTEVRRRPHCWKEVSKLSSFGAIYEGLISRLFEQFQSFLLRLIFLMFSAGSTICGCGGGATAAAAAAAVAVGADDVSSSRGCRRRRRHPVTKHSSLTNIMRASQSFMVSLDRICFKNAFKSRPPHSTTNATVVTVTKSTTNSIAMCLLVYGAAATLLLPQPVLADEGDNFFSPNGIVIGETTTEFDYASRGQKKFGDKCDNTLECGFPGSICDTKKKSCQCTEDLPVTNHIDKCGKEAAVNESCFFNEQCEAKYFQTECRDGRCVCRFDMTPIWLKDGSVECKGRGDKKSPETYIDPAMIGVLIGMALMFIIICVVLRLFSQARWRENRTIFNTPNPRLMNVSLLRESKLLHGQERRGSRMSVRAPSRQPSMASLRPHSPNPSLGKTGSRSNSHGSNASATSLRSTRSNSVSPAINHAHHERKGSTYHPPPPHQLHQQQHHPQNLPPPEGTVQQQQPLQQLNIIANPVAESVTVDIIEPEK